MKRWIAVALVLVACKREHHAAAVAGPAKIGDTVTFEDSEWVIVEAKDAGKVLTGTSALHEEKRTAGRFVQVHYRVTNKGDHEEMLVNPPKIVDAQKDEIEHLELEGPFVPPNAKVFALDTLEPHKQRDLWTVFDVPANATALACRLHALKAYGESRDVDLGM